jgi:REP element-mobilizing transposase RayT
MARQLRLEYPGAIYHVASRGDRSQPIVRDDTDRERFLETVREVCELLGWRGHALCLLDNHFHMVVETPAGNLVAGMKWLLGTYTLRFNRRHKLPGRLFRGRYESQIVDGSGAGYLRRVCDHVHLNPVRAKALKPDQRLSAYRWSSYGEYLKPAELRWPWLRVDRLLAELGIARDDAGGRRDFEQAMEALRASNLESSSTSDSGERWAWCVGDGQFREGLLHHVSRQMREHHTGVERAECKTQMAERLVQVELGCRQWTERELVERRKRDPEKLKIAQRLRRETPVSLRWIAQRLRMGTRANLANWLSKAARVSIVGTDPLAVVLGAWLCVAPAAPGAVAEAAAGAEAFFENKVRPILADHCYECHSQKQEKTKGGLTLDTRDSTRKGGESGPAIVPGDPDRSLLIRAVRYGDEALQMPPNKKRLTPAQVADLEEWVRIGAPDPRVEVPAKNASSAPHWAFRPVSKPAVPAVRNGRWPQNPVDAFVLARLERAGMRPSAPAQKRTLIRRVYLNLTGLPPSSEAVDAFLADPAEDAYARVVDGLLASPHYGERWARHWLDIARYADTKGYVFEEERRYAFAYTYRDYVIQALNTDLPYDRFLRQQIAADLLPAGEEPGALAALGFFTLGRRFLNNPHDIIDDRIDVLSRGTMALTVTCARCHDHKYDPISMRDYYGLYAVFASTSEPAEKPVLGAPPVPADHAAYLAEKRKRDDELQAFRAAKERETRERLRRHAGDYMLAAHEAKPVTDPGRREALARERKLDPKIVQRWIAHLEQAAQSASHPVFGLWHAFARLETNGFSAAAAGLLDQLKPRERSAGSDLAANGFVLAVFGRTNVPASMAEVAARYNELFTAVDEAWQKLVANAGSNQVPAALLNPELEAVRLTLYASDSPANPAPDEIPRLFDVPTAQKVRALKRKVEELDATHAGAPPRAMVLRDNPTPAGGRIFLRGNPNNPGPEVPRQFIELARPPGSEPFRQGSGRLELAEAVTSRHNPLTARVLVNRIWLHHFGAGLVRTPSDFGLRSDPPSHPELLDYLAAEFMEHGWSMKWLHRQLLLSNTFRQASDAHPVYEEQDPNNQLLWRMNRRRLELEPMRDSILAVSGQLDLRSGGQPVEIAQPPFVPRRSVYGFIERQNLPSMFRTFDLASPDTTSPQRFLTTVPQQALFLMNGPFVVGQARALARRASPLAPSGPSGDLDRRIDAAFRTAFQRSPSNDERALARRFIEQPPPLPEAPPAPPAWQYGMGAINVEGDRLTGFAALAHFTGSAWQGGTNLPDATLGWVMLTADGGHAGDDLNRAAVRRWLAPFTGSIAVTATLKHDSEKGDGVRATVFSSRSGRVASWQAHHATQETNLERLEVQAGDAVDFVVDCRQSMDSDSFQWAPVIRRLGVSAAAGAAGTAGELGPWQAKADFAGPPPRVEPLTPWEQFAQVLLMSNELVFVD